jgi:hypothetical protein
LSDLLVSRGFSDSGELRHHGIALFLKPPGIPRQRIDLAQVIQHRAANSVVGESPELQVARWIESVDSLDETNRAGRDQVVELDVRATPMQAPREEFDLWHVIENECFAMGFGHHGEILVREGGRLRGGPLGRLGFRRAVQASDAVDPDLRD